MNFAEQAAQLQAEVDRARARYETAKRGFKQANDALHKTGFEPTQDSAFACQRAQSADLLRQQAFDQYMAALKRFNDFILRYKLPE